MVISAGKKKRLYISLNPLRERGPVLIRSFIQAYLPYCLLFTRVFFQSPGNELKLEVRCRTNTTWKTIHLLSWILLTGLIHLQQLPSSLLPITATQRKPINTYCIQYQKIFWISITRGIFPLAYVLVQQVQLIILPYIFNNMNK